MYHTQLDNRHIRLLEIVPGQQPLLQTNVLLATLDDIPPFEALSYVWGDLSTKETVLCDGIRVEVTVNLYDALLHLRLLDQPRRVWADAICINQTDPVERSEQVGLMHEIYTRATRVVLWLGRDNGEDTGAAIALISRIHDACITYAESIGKDVNGPEYSAVLVAVRPSEMHAEPHEWEALRKFYARPWFTRVWCVQEIILGKDPLVLVGNETVSWDLVGVAASWLDNEAVAHDFELPDDSPSVIVDIPAFNAYCMHDKDDLDGQLLETLTKFRGFESTDPRDKVYGLLGLLKGGGPQVNYQKSLPQVYEDVVTWCIESTSSLKILSSVKHGSTVELGECPSWVPRWDRSPNVGTLSDREIGFCAGGESPLEDVCPAQAGILELKGIMFDEVESTEKIMDMDLFNDSDNSNESHLFIDLWDKIGSRDDPVSELCQLARTLTAGLTATWANILECQEDDCNQFYSDFAGFMQHLLQRAGRRSRAFAPESFAVMDPRRDQFRIAASRSCEERRLFFTKRGSYGIGPACMAADDIVVVFFGGAVPYVLRPLREGFLFLGACYVDDIMYGELTDRAGGCGVQEQMFHLY